jgi:stalled ribosome alternative rescue factor ArfA
MMAISLNKKKNFIAKSLKDPKFNQRIVKPKKGKGSFKRKKIKSV